MKFTLINVDIGHERDTFHSSERERHISGASISTFKIHNFTLI